MNLDMKEKSQGWAMIGDVSAPTFERFVEWAYKGYYTAATHTVEVLEVTGLSDEEEGEAATTEPPPAEASEDEVRANGTRNIAVEEDEEWGFGWGGSRDKPKKKDKKKAYYATEPPMPDIKQFMETASQSKQSMKESFVNRRRTVLKSAIQIPPPRGNKAADEDYTEVFLSHAHLYVFANSILIQDLKTLALENLHATLEIFDLHQGRTGDIIALLRYVYENTDERGDSPDELQKLMADYMGCEMDTLLKDEEFKNLMIEEKMVKDGGRLLGDFMRMVMKRI